MAGVSVDRRIATPPLQERSRRTYEKILDALEELLRQKPFEAITVRELVLRSGTSTGSFYARFPMKGTLLPALYDRYDANLHATASAVVRKGQMPPAGLETGATLEATVRAILERVVNRMYERRWLMRAVSLHARQHPELITDETRTRRSVLHAKWRGELLRFRDRIDHPDPETAVAFGLFMTITACREKVVFAEAPHAASFDLTAERLIEEATRALLRYLGVWETKSEPGG